MATGKGAGYKYKVLIVDDEALNIEFLQTLLSEEINVIFATSGEDALAIVKANRPDMILLDIMMPGMDGYEVCKRLKGDELTKDIPVIFVTAKEGPEEEARGLQLGAIDYITKPFNPEIVKSKVRNNIIRIATPRPDLTEHHNTERRRDRRDRRASDRINPWKWLAGAAVVALLALIMLAIAPENSLNLDALRQLAGQSPSSQETGPAKPASPVQPDRKEAAAPTPSKTPPVVPADSKPAVVTPVPGRTLPLDMKWVLESKCPVIPEVAWWRFNSHLSVVRYVERNLKGDWKSYEDKWQKRLEGVADIYSRNSTAVTNTGVQLSGDELAEYIVQLKTRMEAIECLRAEARIQREKQ